MSKILVAYFSASGVTAEKAVELARGLDGDLFEIRPVHKYSAEDLDWTNKRSRSTVESQDATARPAVTEKVRDPEQYDKVLVGFPIWWYTAPRIIQTFLEQNDLKGKKIVLFATSGGSSPKKARTDLAALYPDLDFVGDYLVNGAVSEKTLKEIRDC